jgi:hypothetical protein
LIIFHIAIRIDAGHIAGDVMADLPCLSDLHVLVG